MFRWGQGNTWGNSVMRDDRLRDTVIFHIRFLPNFEYNKINSNYMNIYT